MTRRIQIEGLPTGAQFAFTASDPLGQTAPVSWVTGSNGWGNPSDPPSEGASVQIVARQSPLMVAPAPVWFDVIVSGFDATQDRLGPYDPALNTLYAVWDFDDPLAEYDVPERLQPWMRDPNGQTGLIAAFCYERPGTYTPSVRVYEPSSGKWAEATLAEPLVVADPDVFFAGAKTVFITAEEPGDAPAGATVVSTFADAVTHIRAAGNAALRPFRLMFRAGESFDHAGVLSRWDKGNPGSVHIVGQSGSARPELKVARIEGTSGKIINFNGNQQDWPNDEIVVSGLRIYTDFDVLATSSPEVTRMTFIDNPLIGTILTHRCELEGLTAFVSEGPLYGAGMTVQIEKQRFFCHAHNKFRSFADFGYYSAQSGMLAFLGNDIGQHPDALIKSGGGVAGKTHGPIRINGSVPAQCVIDGNDLFSRTGWSALGTRLGAQPTLRWNQFGAEGASLVFTRNVSEGGYICLKLSHMNGTAYRYGAGNAIIRQNVIVGSAQTHRFIETQTPVTVEGNLFIRPEGDTYSSGGISFIHLAPPGDTLLDRPSAPNPVTFGHLDFPVVIRGNHFVSLMAGTAPGISWPAVVNVGNSYTNVTFENNIEHQPNWPTPITPFGPLDAETILFAPKYKGYKALPEDEFLHPTSPETIASYAPLIGSIAISGAVGVTSYQDIAGVERPETPSVGAWEVDE